MTISALASLVGLSPGATATVDEAADMAKTVFGGGGFSRIAGMVKAHDFGDLVDLGIRDIASCIAIADPALASIAPLAASIIIYARHHPASVESPAMEKASGNGNFTGE